ncbi:MAG: ABC transporter substrate-binding protein [Gemmatimonadales bacterium]
MRAARRIVSLLPSATEIVCALGLGDRLVGVSHGCDYPAAVTRLPRVSRSRRDLTGLSGGAIDAAIRGILAEHESVYEVDVAAVADLAPDLILTQGLCDVCAVPAAQVARAWEDLPSPPDVLTLDAHDVGAILGSIVAVGAATGTPAKAAACVATLEQRIAAVRRRVAGRRRPRVLALEWLDPPYVPGHWVPELIAAAGGELIAGRAGRPSYRVEWRDLAGADPDLLLLMPCGYDRERTIREAAGVREHLLRVAPRAIAARRAYAVEAGAYFSRPGPRFVDGLETLAALAHAGRYFSGEEVCAVSLDAGGDSPNVSL